MERHRHSRSPAYRSRVHRQGRPARPRLLGDGKALLTVVEDTCGRHDTIYGCCSEPNNFLRYGVRGTPSCYANFREILAQFGLDARSIVGNVNFFMSVPVLPDGSAGVADGVSPAGSLVELRAAYTPDVARAVSGHPPS